MKKQDLFKLTILLLLVMIVYLPTFVWMVERWTAPDTAFSHGFLVPFISGIVVWQKRKRLRELTINPDSSGWLFLILGISMHLVSATWQIYFSSGFSLILVLMGLVLLFLGKEFLREALFSVLFLALMVPLPVITIADLSFKLRMFAAQMAAILLNILGAQAIREGSIIKTAHSYLVVTDACSGIRSIITLAGLGALIAYFNSISTINRTILILLSVPIAVFANVVRITALSVVNETHGAAFATGLFHTLVGILVFISAFLMLSFICHLLKHYEQ